MVFLAITPSGLQQMLAASNGQWPVWHHMGHTVWVEAKADC